MSKRIITAIGVVCIMGWVLLLVPSYGYKAKCGDLRNTYKASVLEQARVHYKCTTPSITNIIHPGGVAYQFSVDACGKPLVYECGRFCEDCSLRCLESKDDN